MKPYNPSGHSAYQERALAQLRKYYPDAATSLPASTWEIMEKFWNLDLSDMDILMADRYSDFGPAPKLPSDMLRSILLSGFSVGDTSGISTFYDFHIRLWSFDKNNLSDPVHLPKEKPKKPEKKGEKAPPVEKITVKELFVRNAKNVPATVSKMASGTAGSLKRETLPLIPRYRSNRSAHSPTEPMMPPKYRECLSILATMYKLQIISP